MLAPEGATVSLLQCQQEASAQKNSGSRTTTKAFQWKSREGTRGVSPAVDDEYVRKLLSLLSSFLTISDSNRVHCAIVLKQSRLFH